MDRVPLERCEAAQSAAGMVHSVPGVSVGIRCQPDSSGELFLCPLPTTTPVGCLLNPIPSEKVKRRRKKKKQVPKVSSAAQCFPGVEQVARGRALQ